MAATNKWTQKVTVIELAKPWWTSVATLAVTRVSVADALTLDAHVVRSRLGTTFVAMPSTRRENGWRAVVELLDESLKDAITEAVLVAYDVWSPDTAVEVLPF